MPLRTQPAIAEQLNSSISFSEACYDVFNRVHTNCSNSDDWTRQQAQTNDLLLFFVIKVIFFLTSERIIEVFCLMHGPETLFKFNGIGNSFYEPNSWLNIN